MEKIKKLISLLAILILPVFSLFGLTACNDQQKIEKLKISEVTHSVFYAPLYIAKNNKFFEDEGITVEISNGNGSNNVMTSIISGQADIGLAGPETVIYNAARKNKDRPTVFGQLTACDGSFLISRTKIDNWKPENVKNKTIIAGRRGGMPAMTLQYGLHLAGLEANIDYTLDLSIDFGMVAGAFEGGKGDYCTMFEPTASAYQAANKGYIVSSIGKLGGNVPYTAFIANQKFLDKKSLSAEKFLRAVYRGYQYLVNMPIDDVVNSLLPSFVGSDKTHIKKAIQNYLNINAFASTPVMNLDSYNRLIDITKFAGELDKDINIKFDDVIDNTIAQKTVKYFEMIK